MQKIKVADLCCGIGGFRLGLTAASDRFIFPLSAEKDNKCTQTYLCNFKEPVTFSDVFDIPNDGLLGTDLLTAGFPCQPYSTTGKQLGFQDERADVLHKILDLITTSKPRVVLFENVTGLLTTMNGQYFEYIIEFLEALGYTVSYNVLNSVNFGLPQTRKRLFIVAALESLSFNFPEGSDVVVPVSSILDKSLGRPLTPRWEMIINHWSGKQVLDPGTLPRSRRAVKRLIGTTDLQQCILVEKRSGTIGYSVDGPLPTFVAGNSGGGANIPMLVHERRFLGVKEIQRCMGFSDCFSFPVSMTDSFKQLGNAVCPPVIAAIGKSLLDCGAF